MVQAHLPRPFFPLSYALRCVLNWDSYFIFADNTDKIFGFVWKFTVLSQPKLSWRMISEAS